MGQFPGFTMEKNEGEDPYSIKVLLPKLFKAIVQSCCQIIHTAQPPVASWVLDGEFVCFVILSIRESWKTKNNLCWRSSCRPNRDHLVDLPGGECDGLNCSANLHAQGHQVAATLLHTSCSAPSHLGSHCRKRSHHFYLWSILAVFLKCVPSFSISLCHQ